MPYTSESPDAAAMTRLALLSLLFAGPALAQDAAPVRQPVDPALTGTWEMVEMDVPGADVEVVAMTVTFEGDDATTAMTFRADGEVHEEVLTSECATIKAMVQCVSTGERAGQHSAFGKPEITDETVRFTVPGFDGYYAVFRRVQ